MKDKLLQVLNDTFNLNVVFVDAVEGAKTTLYRFNLCDPLKISIVKTPKFQLQLNHVLKQQTSVQLGEKYDFGILVYDKPKGILSSKDLKEGKGYSFPIAKTIDGRNVFLNFGEQITHVLIAGASGSGKSVLLNTLINKALEQLGPNNCQFLFIDTKRVELSKYGPKFIGGMNNYVSDIGPISLMLREMNYKMDERYKKLEADPSMVFVPIFIIIDELADITLTRDKMCRDSIEMSLARIAQMGRGASIYLIVATQNPLAKVCTPLLKANTTTKICLKCSNYHQSIVILDHRGGEDLFGKGDAIIKLPFMFEELRAQVAFTPKEIIEANCKKWYDLDEGHWLAIPPCKWAYRILHGRSTGERKLAKDIPTLKEHYD